MSIAVRIGQRGLTLIELMIVVAVLAILATIAVPTYDRYQRGARRADGKSGLTAVALAQERVFSVYQRYVALKTLETLGGLDSTLADGDSPKGKYSLSVVRNATSFTVSATPKPNAAADPECGVLTLDSTGAKTESGTKTLADCW
jgi:type IV pilus assembly protein PilE